ncbi:MAG: prepilin peptidase [Acidobacteria bacterium]|nr:prepilin peptidase [Acidobacteriota bacterium]
MTDSTFTAALAALVGAAFGSFANVAVYRVPRRESLVRPRSRCPSCGAQIAARDNVPVVSWLLLRGRCRRCRAPISARYPAVEALTALLFALVALRLPSEGGGSRWDLLPYLPLMLVLVILSFIDLEHRVLPNRIVLPAIAVEIALFAVAAWRGPGLDAWVRGVEAGGAAFAFFMVLALISPRGMGMGDVKLSALLGLALGYLGWGRLLVGFFLAFVLGALVGLALIARGRAGMKSHVPFGPSLALGAVIGVLYGGPIVERWLGR